jgi:hypothetical protein
MNQTTTSKQQLLAPVALVGCSPDLFTVNRRGNGFIVSDLYQASLGRLRLRVYSVS